MIEVQETDSGLYVTDAAKNELHIEMPDWEEGGQEKTINREVDEKISGFSSEIRFPQSAVCVVTEGRDQWRTFVNGKEVSRIEYGTHQIQVASNIDVYIKLIGNFKIFREEMDSKILLKFDQKIPITFGFRCQIRIPNYSIETPAEPGDLARAISHLSVEIESERPDKSYPSLRGYPPLIEVNNDLKIPDELIDEFSTNGISIEVPNDLPSIFKIAPLTYYLQAKLIATDRKSPKLNIPEYDINIELSSESSNDHNPMNLLKRCFWLDCIVRNEGPFGVDLQESEIISELDIDAADIYSASPQRRLSTYLNVDFNSIKSYFPKWHLSTYVDPKEENISAIPHLLDRLSQIYSAESRDASIIELIENSQDEYYRSSRYQTNNSSVNRAIPKSPSIKKSRAHGWLADGYPINVYKLVPQAFENNLDKLDSVNESKKIVVIQNEPDMAEEKSIVSKKYADRAHELAIDVTVKDNVTIEELRTLFESQLDFIHYIGHCTKDGLKCSDGFLSLNRIQSCEAKTFFLNACGSFQEGVRLVKNGAIGGVVTRNKVLNQQATQIGSKLAELMINGMEIEVALRLATKNTIIKNIDYFVVGDGTFRLVQSDDLAPGIIQINSKSENQYDVNHMSSTIRQIGACYQSYLDNKNKFRLSGNYYNSNMNRDVLFENLKEINEPVIFDDTYYWSDDLHIKLQN